MKKIIYINNDQLTIVGGKLGKDGSIKGLFTEYIALPQGSVLNGVILAKEAVVEALKEHRKLLNKATLMLNSSHIITKKMTLPQLSEAQVMSVLKKEFSLLGQNEKYVYDFSRIGKSEEQHILACALPEHFLVSYKEIFEEAGITIKQIDVALNGILKWAKVQRSIQSKCCVLNVMEQHTMTSVLLQGGNYVFHNKTRLVNEPLTGGYSAELFTSLSSMIQFNKSQKSEYSIEASYYVGIQEEAVSQLSRLIDALEDTLTVQTIPCEVKEETFYALTGLYTAERDINLAQGVKNTKRVYWRELRWLGKAINTVLIAGIILSTGIWINQVNEGYEKRTREIEDYLVSAEVLKALGEVSELEAQVALLEEAVDNVEDTRHKITTSKIIDGDMLTKLYEVAGETIQIRNISYGEAERRIHIEGSATGVHDAEKFVLRVKATDIFEDVDYAGYSRQGENGYSFSMTILCKEVEASDNESN